MGEASGGIWKHLDACGRHLGPRGSWKQIVPEQVLEVARPVLHDSGEGDAHQLHSLRTKVVQHFGARTLTLQRPHMTGLEHICFSKCLEGTPKTWIRLVLTVRDLEIVRRPAFQKRTGVSKTH